MVARPNRTWFVALAFLAACGRFGFEEAPELVSSSGNARDLVGWWKLDDVDNVAHDSSENQHLGTVLGDMEWSAGVIDGAAHFDGVDDQIEIPHHSRLNATDALTLSIWIYPEQPGDDPPTYTQFFTKGDSYFSGWGLRFLNSRKILFQMTGQNGNTLVSATSLPLDQWTHVIATFDGEEARIYLNEELDASLLWSGVRLSDLSSIWIGGFEPNFVITGAVDDARIYTRAFTEAEIDTF